MTDAQQFMAATSGSHAVDHDHHDDHGHFTPQESLENAKFAMWLYIGSEVMVFSGMLVAYLIFRRFNADIVMEAKEHLSIALVSFNTFLLLASSWAMVMGLREVQRGNNRGLVKWLSLTVVMGAAFVALQVVEYAELAHYGVVLTGGEPLARYGMRFYAPTAFHGAHVIVGVLWGMWIINKGWRNQFTSERYAAVEVFGLYWHFVDVVWIILFTFIYLI